MSSASQGTCDVGSSSPSAPTRPAPWEGGKCRVPMWRMGLPAGFCDEPAFGPQLPQAAIVYQRGYLPAIPYCVGPCCPKHLGPAKGEPILFMDGSTPDGRPMWCAVDPDFVNLQESPAGFDANPVIALHALKAARDMGSRVAAQVPQVLRDANK